MWFDKQKLVDATHALKGRAQAILHPNAAHRVFGVPLEEVPDGAEIAYFAMGCFWGAERIFWRLAGVVNTAVGYQGGFTPNPTYEEVCSGRTGHAEVVRVVFDPSKIGYGELVKAFFENHDPTHRNRQGNDVGTQYRSAIFTTSAEQAAAAESTRSAFAEVVATAVGRQVTTEIAPAGAFYLAEGYHQQYLESNPNGYCNHGPNGLTCPIGVANLPAQTDVLPPTAGAGSSSAAQG